MRKEVLKAIKSITRNTKNRVNLQHAEVVDNRLYCTDGHRMLSTNYHLERATINSLGDHLAVTRDKSDLPPYQNAIPGGLKETDFVKVIAPKTPKLSGNPIKQPIVELSVEGESFGTFNLGYLVEAFDFFGLCSNVFIAGGGLSPLIISSSDDLNTDFWVVMPTRIKSGCTAMRLNLEKLED